MKRESSKRRRKSRDGVKGVGGVVGAAWRDDGPSHLL